MYQDWSTDQGDYINNIEKYRREELNSRRKLAVKKLIKATVIYTIGFIIYFLIIKWI